MIVLDLECERGHRFEAWFGSSEGFEAQRDADLVACPECGSSSVRRLLSAPHVHVPSASAASRPPPDAAARRDTLARLMKELRETARRSEDVGERFAEEARRIHYGDADERAIRGRAAPDEVRELLDEGIGVLPVPPDPNDLN